MGEEIYVEAALAAALPGELGRLIHHLGRLYLIARAVGLEPVEGEWPDFTYMGNETGHDVWVLSAGEDQAEPFHSEPLKGLAAGMPHTVVPALGGITDPYEAAKVIYQEVCDG